MLFPDHLVLFRGGGDLATGAVWRLAKAGFPIVVTELAEPLTIRRAVAVSSAVQAGEVSVEGMDAVRYAQTTLAVEAARRGLVTVLVEPGLPDAPHSVVVDARMAKRNIDTGISDADLVIGLGPGFTAGVDCHAVVETQRGHRLGRVIWSGRAAADTGRPGLVGGRGADRVIWAASSGVVQWDVAIGDRVVDGERLGTVGGSVVTAPFAGVVRGLIADGSTVEGGVKVADVDPRSARSAAFEISDKALAIGGGVLEAIVTWLNR